MHSTCEICKNINNQQYIYKLVQLVGYKRELYTDRPQFKIGGHVERYIRHNPKKKMKELVIYEPCLGRHFGKNYIYNSGI